MRRIQLQLYIRFNNLTQYEQEWWQLIDENNRKNGSGKSETLKKKKSEYCFLKVDLYFLHLN